MRAGYNSDAARDLNNVRDRIAEFKELMEGIIPSQTADKILPTRGMVITQMPGGIETESTGTILRL